MGKCTPKKAKNTQNDPFWVFWGYRKWHLGCPNQNSKTTFQIKYPHLDLWGAIFNSGKVIFGHFIDFGHFPIEAEIFYGKWKEVSYSKNKNSFEISEENGTTCRNVQS